MTHCISLQWSEHESSHQQLALQGSTKHLWSLWGASRTLSFVAGPTEEIFWLCVSRGGHWLSVLMYWICFLFWNFGNFRRWVESLTGCTLASRCFCWWIAAWMQIVWGAVLEPCPNFTKLHWNSICAALFEPLNHSAWNFTSRVIH